MKFIIYPIAFILIGITLEIFWTSIFNYKKTKNKKFIGKTSLWMFPIYAIVPLIYIFVLNYLFFLSIFLRGIIYMIFFYILEYISGYLIKKITKTTPWNYKNKKYNLKGLICLEYVPVWYIYGILGEFLFIFITSFF